jgi:hypothetical protein
MERHWPRQPALQAALARRVERLTALYRDMLARAGRARRGEGLYAAAKAVDAAPSSD